MDSASLTLTCNALSPRRFSVSHCSYSQQPGWSDALAKACRGLLPARRRRHVWSPQVQAVLDHSATVDRSRRDVTADNVSAALKALPLQMCERALVLARPADYIV